MAEKKGKVLLAIDYATNWYERFKGCKLANGEPIIVEQTRWKYVNLESCSHEGVVVWCQKNEDPFPFTSQKNDRAVKPDFILIRNFPTALRANDFKSILLGLMFANVPAINSLHSVFMCMHRPLVYSELNRIKLEVFKDVQSVVVDKPSDELSIKKHNAQPARKDVPAVVIGGEETADQERSKLNKFPLIPMRYYPNQSEDFMPPVMKSGIEFPAVVKVGTAHAGYGKMFLKNKSDFDDLKSVIMMSKDYYTAEPLVKFEYEYRIQKLGDKYRTFRRTSDNAWKSNWGDLKYEEFPIKEYQKKWIDECAKMYGGLDMCAIDVLRTADGEDIILELNDTACGLPYEFEPQDSLHIRDMVLARMNQLFCP